MTVVIDPSFNPVPSLNRKVLVSLVTDTTGVDLKKTTSAVFVSSDSDLPQGLSLSREELEQVGFKGKAGQTYAVAGEEFKVLIGTGKGLKTSAELRDAVAAFTRVAKESAALVVDLRGLELEADVAAQVSVEGATLARYKFEQLLSDPKMVSLESLTLIVEADDQQEAQKGVDRGIVLSRTASLARDLANTPPRHLSAAKFGEIAAEEGPKFGLEVEVYGRKEIMDMGLGGLLGVNAGSVEDPRLIKLRFKPQNADAHIGLVGKGIMYDSGGISLKPSNAMHAAMKFDMMGAAAVFSAMTSLQDLGAESAVTGWLMCTDNMPSGSATKLGDVLTIRGGKTVEVKNTDAEGRLVLADGLVLATEEDNKPDAIVDIATLTGAAMAALGDRNAAMLANNDDVAKQLLDAADATDETCWRLPLDKRYRKQLDSEVADLQNIGGQYAGAITAALFLNEFVDDIPWGHLDIAGTMMSERDDLWRSVGSTGFGARLLSEFVCDFKKPAATKK